MSLLNFALYGDKDPKKKKLNLTPQYRTAAELAGASNYVAPASTTVTYQPAPVPQRTIADYAPPPTYWNSSGDLKINYAGGDPYSYDSRRYNGRVIRDMQNEREWDAAKNIGAFGLSVLSDPIALGMSAFDFAKDPSLSNAAFLGLDALTPGNIGGFLKGLTEIGVVGAGAREFAKKGVGRVVTNLIVPEGYGNKFKDLIRLNNTKGLKKMASSVFNDVPIYNDDIVRLPDREFPYRTMFGLNPREIEITQFNKYPGKDLHRFKTAKVDGDPTRISHLGDYPLPTKQVDGTYTVDKNSHAYKTLIDEFLPLNMLQNYDWTKEFTIGGLQNPLFGGFSMKYSPEKGNFTAIDDWDYDLHPGEFKESMKIAAQGLVAKQGVNAFTPLISDILRFAMSKITDPVKYRVPVSIDELKHSDELNKIIGNQYLQKWGREPVR